HQDLVAGHLGHRGSPLSLALGGWQKDADHRASFRPVPRRDPAGVIVNDALHDRQAEPRPSLTPGEEGVEHAIEVLRIEAVAGIFDTAFDPLAASVVENGSDYPNRASRRRVLFGVADQILEDL